MKNYKAGDIEKFCLAVQNAVFSEELFEIFTEFLNSGIRVSSAEIIYQAEKIFEKIIFSDGVVRKEKISEFSFMEKEIEVYTEKSLEIMSIVADYRFQLRVDFAEKVDKKRLQQLNGLVTIFLNHNAFICRVRNLEEVSAKNRDDITALYNQNYLKNFIQKEIARCKRYGGSFSVVFFDLDNLKKINEIHGHLVGTEILKEVSRLLSEGIRLIDLVARFGGDEFVIILLNAEADNAIEVCKRLKNKLNSHSFLNDKGLDLKISGCFGISQFPVHGDTVDDLIRKSDLAMYEVKKQGKNGINVFRGDI